MSKVCLLNFRDRTLPIYEWTPSKGLISKFFAIDTETTLIPENKEIPDYVIGSAYDGSDTVYIINRSRIREFMELHRDCWMVMCNAKFDIHVIEKVTGLSLHEKIEDKQILDVSLLHRLNSLAVVGFLPPKWGLAHLCKEFLGFELDKAVVDGSGLDVRTNFGRYLNSDGSVDFNNIPPEALQYAALDAVVTWEVHKPILKKSKELSINGSLLTHDIQLKADYALAAVERHGCYIDKAKVLQLKSEVQSKIQASLEYLKSCGWTGYQISYEEIIKNLEAQHGFTLPRTRTGKISTAREALLPYCQYPFIKNYLDYYGYVRFDSTFVMKLQNQEVLYPNFNVLVATGRTSSHDPNFQNFPTDGGIRECFIPRPGYKYLIADYSMLELCTLAQICLSKFGTSRLAALINDGVDLHKWFASRVLNKSIDEVSKQERQLAKACNFGFPGGLGVSGFMAYAQSSFGVHDLTESKARELKNLWLSAFPEMARYLAWDDFDGFDTRKTVTTLTGRVRGQCSYTQAKNTPFQGLASDGTKQALFALIRKGFRVINFVHDEYIIEVKDDEHFQDTGLAIQEIMISEMKKVCPDVRISVEWIASDCWRKP